MASYEQFLRTFTEEEKKTDVVKIWASLASNTEKTVLEELVAQNYEISDINNFNKDTYESWLGFFMRKIRNRVAPRCRLTITNKCGKSVRIPIGTVYNTPNGTYVQENSIDNLANNAKATVTAIQGRIVTHTVEYKDYMTFNATNVDLDTIRITDSNGSSVKEVSYHKSFGSLNHRGACCVGNGLLYIGYDNTTVMSDDSQHNTFGDYYEVVESGTVGGDTRNPSQLTNTNLNKGDMIIFDGSHWVVNTNIRELLPYQLEYEYAIPRNGYYAYSSDGKLYIKIFKGSEVADPQGRTYTVTYCATDGALGEVKSGNNQFRFSSTINDTSDRAVNTDNFIIENSESTNGITDVTRGQLKNLLRQSFFCGTTISSMPEYNAWFNAQAEIGNAYVYSDYEQWLRTGKRGNSTGFIYILALNSNGEPITENSATANTLTTRILPYKDVGFLKFVEPNPIRVCFEIRYKSSSDDIKLNSMINSIIRSYFDINSLREIGATLFDDLDLSQIIRDINESYNVIGIDVLCYHYYSGLIGSDGELFIETTNDEPIGNAKYILNKDRDSIEVWEVPTFNPSDTTTATIKMIVDNSVVNVGTRNGNSITLSGLSSYNGYTLEVKIPTKDSAILTIDDMKSYRVLIEDTQNIKAIDIERYE